MTIKLRIRFLAFATMGVLALGNLAGRAGAKEKQPPVPPDDATLRLYQFLDSSSGGKLEDLYLIADTFKDPKAQDQERQHILKVEYDRTKAFGKLRIYVRIVDKLTPEQLKTYTTKQIFEFAETDSEKFTKTDPGSLGRPGDVYFLPASEGGPLATAPITDEARSTYDRYITDYILPALQKK